MARPERILDVNRRYHDAVAGEYDSKWGIGFGTWGGDQVLGKVGKLLGERPGPYGRALEVGAGTGYFSLNMMAAGVIGEAVCTDVSPGMLEALERNAEELGLEVGTVACDASALPFPDDSFDLVIGHAVLHHLPDVEHAFREFARVLRPGGTLFFAGEPSLYGDRASSIPKRVAWRLSPLWRRAVGARPAGAAGNGAAHRNGDGEADGHELECEVDVHAFTPGALAGAARAAGLEQVRVRGEELLASWFGWFNRTLEASAEQTDIPMAWIQLRLQRLPRAAAGGPRAARAAPAPGDLLQPHDRRAEALVLDRAVDVGRVAAQAPPARRLAGDQRGRPHAHRHAVAREHVQRPLGDRDLAERGRVHAVGHHAVAGAEVAEVDDQRPRRLRRGRSGVQLADLVGRRGRVAEAERRGQHEHAVAARAQEARPPRRSARSNARGVPVRSPDVVHADVEAADVVPRAGRAACARERGDLLAHARRRPTRRRPRSS